MKNEGKKLVVAFVIGLVFFLNCGDRVLAFQAEETKEIPIQSLKFNNNGGTVQFQKSKKDGIWVDFDTTGEKKGYYTTYIYAEQKEVIGNDTVISFHMKTKQKVRMNVDVVLSTEYHTYTTEEGAKVFLKRDGSNQFEVRFIEYGAFEVPENFSGNVYFPISTEEISLETYGIGFTFVLSQEERVEFFMDKIDICSGTSCLDDVLYMEFEVKGEEYPEIPMYGEYYYSYKVKFTDGERKNHQVTFSLEKPVEGVTVDSSGRLSVKSGTKPQTILIMIQINKLLQYQWEVELTESWLAKVENVDVSSFVVPAVEDVKPVGSEIEIPYTFLRVLGFIMSITFGIFYILKIRRKG